MFLLFLRHRGTHSATPGNMPFPGVGEKGEKEPTLPYRRVDSQKAY